MMRIIGDDIYFADWKIGKVLDIAPATIRSEFCAFVEGAEKASDLEDAAFARGYEEGRRECGRED